LVREHVRKIIGKVSVPKVMTVHHPAIARLIAQDEIRRQKQAAPPTDTPGTTRF